MDTPKNAGKSPIRHEAEAGKPYAWCSCGLSAKQPYCDGSHGGTNFRPMVVKEEESKPVFLCTCKQSKNPPYCDGSHSKV